LSLFFILKITDKLFWESRLALHRCGAHLVQGRRQPAPHCREASGAGDIVSLFYYREIQHSSRLLVFFFDKPLSKC
jgi:hypothetical protein